MTGAGRGRGAGAGMAETVAAGLGSGFLGLDGMRMPLSARPLRSQLRKVRESSRLMLLIWVLFWSAFSSYLLFRINSQAVEKRQEALASICDEHARMLDVHFNISVNQLQALAITVSTFHHSKNPSAMDQMTFAMYAERTAFEGPLTTGVAYAVRVTHDEREQFERQQGWSIKKMYSSNSKNRSQEPAEELGKKFPSEISEIFGTPDLPVEIAEEYAPVIFAVDTYRHIISFDMLSGNEDRESIRRARESGKAVLTSPFKMFTNRLGVILTYTVYNSELPPNAKPQERIQAAIGYLGCIFDLEAVVDKLCRQLARKQSIMLNVYDTTNESPIIMYGPNHSSGMGHVHVSTLNFGDPSRKHEMHCRFSQRPPWPWLAMSSSFGTLVKALLIGHIFHATLKWVAKFEDYFQERTALKKHQESLATVSHEIRTPMNNVLGDPSIPLPVPEPADHLCILRAYCQMGIL